MEETQINIAALIENQKELPEENEEHYQNARTKTALFDEMFLQYY